MIQVLHFVPCAWYVKVGQIQNILNSVLSRHSAPPSSRPRSICALGEGTESLSAIRKTNSSSLEFTWQWEESSIEQGVPLAMNSKSEEDPKIQRTSNSFSLASMEGA